jgi:hypothetical protein
VLDLWVSLSQVHESNIHVILDFLISKGTTVLDVARRVIWRLAQGNVGEGRAREGRGRLRLTNPTNGYDRLRKATEGYGRA